MSNQCPKCGYERKPNDPLSECPSCGIIYKKYLSRKRRNEKVQPKTDHTEKKIDSSGAKPSKPYALFGLIAISCLIIGYFAGREHIKYEMRSVIQNVANDFKQNISTIFNGGNSDTSLSSPSKKEKHKIKPPKVAPPSPLNVSLLKKRFTEREYDNAITFEIRIENLTGNNIRAFDGHLVFLDLLDNEILSASLAINNPVNSYGSLEWSGELDYNQFIDRHQRLRSAKFENIKIVFNTEKILFEDGTVVEYE